MTIKSNPITPAEKRARLEAAKARGDKYIAWPNTEGNWCIWMMPEFTLVAIRSDQVQGLVDEMNAREREDNGKEKPAIVVEVTGGCVSNVRINGDVELNVDIHDYDVPRADPDAEAYADAAGHMYARERW